MIVYVSKLRWRGKKLPKRKKVSTRGKYVITFPFKFKRENKPSDILLNEVKTILRNTLYSFKFLVEYIKTEPMKYHVSVTHSRHLYRRHFNKVKKEVNKTIGMKFPDSGFSLKLGHFNDLTIRKNSLSETFSTGIGSVGIGGVVSGGKGQGAPKGSMTISRKKRSPKRTNQNPFRNHER